MKILVVQTAFIGDLIMSTPIFRALSVAFPNAEIHALVIPSASIILKHNPFVSKVFSFDKKNSLIGKLKSLFKIIQVIRKEKYDFGFALQQSSTTSLMLLLGGVRRRVGNHRLRFATDRIIIPKGRHIRQRVLEYVRPFTKSDLSSDTEVFLSESELKVANEIVSKAKSQRLIAIAPGSVRATKRWNVDSYKALVELLTKNDYYVFLVGSKDEHAVNQSIVERVNSRNIKNLSGELSLLESAALIEKCNLMICNDSSPLHIANAVGTDVFAFFGPTVRSFGCYPWRSRDKMLEVDLDCRPCHKHGSDKCPLGHHNCMNEIKPEYVFSLICEHFDKYYPAEEV